MEKRDSATNKAFSLLKSSCNYLPVIRLFELPNAVVKLQYLLTKLGPVLFTWLPVS